jgi:hypothetical protein
LVVCFAGILDEYHVDLPYSHGVAVLILVLLKEARERAEELIETDCVNEERLVQAVDLVLRDAQV